MTRDTTATLALVRRCWADVLGSDAVPGVTWEEAGGDSLATLHLLLALEQALGRRLSFDLVAPDATDAALAAAVAALLDPAALPVPAPARAVPTVFLFPGVFGDEPRLAGFRRCFAQRVRFEVVAHPELDAPAATLAAIGETARVAVGVIQRLQPHGALRLAGYSFGGCVAFEAARQLHEAGRRIAGVVLLDSHATVEPAAPGADARVDKLVVIGGFDVARRLVLAAIRRWRPQRAFGARRRLLFHFRRRAMREWQPGPLSAERALLAVSAGCPAQVVDGWRRLCPGIGVVHLPSTHDTLFDPASMTLLGAAFEDAVRLDAWEALAH